MAKKTTKKKTIKQDWNNISGTIAIFANESESGKMYYSTSLGRKNNEGDYDNLYLTVRFSKSCQADCEPEEPGRYFIDMAEAFLKPEFWEDKKGNQKSALVLFVNDGCMLPLDD